MMTLTDLDTLEGKIVLVRSRRDLRNPPTGLRGTIHIVNTGNEPEYPHVELVLQYPAMFLAPSHQRVILLSAAEVERLLSSEKNGVYEFTTDDSLDT